MRAVDSNSRESQLEPGAHQLAWEHFGGIKIGALWVGLTLILNLIFYYSRQSVFDENVIGIPIIMIMSIMLSFGQEPRERIPDIGKKALFKFILFVLHVSAMLLGWTASLLIIY